MGATNSANIDSRWFWAAGDGEISRRSSKLLG
jgi:hypothetical protein